MTAADHDPRGALPPLWAALIPVLTLAALLFAAITLFGTDAAAGASQIALIASASVAAAIAIALGQRWAAIEQAIIAGISVTMKAILILLAVGALIGTWILGGVVPTLIYYGLQILDPSYFYVAVCALCAVVSLSIGSSWTTAGTVGVAMIGIGAGLGLPPAITAGAVISGAYFGDKMSPLSDTTNLAAAVAGADLFAHVRNMLWTTGPSFAMALALFALLGLNAETARAVDLDTTLAALDASFTIGWPMLAPLALVFALAAAQVAAFPALLIGAALGALTAVLFQDQAVAQYGALLGGDWPAVKAVWTAFFDGYVARTGNAAIDDLLSRGGMSGMLTTVWLILSAMIFGSVLEHSGMLARLLQVVVKALRRVGSVVLATLLACIGTNVITGDQYMAIILPGRMLAPVYARFGLAPTTLSRSLEDAGTLTSPLVPWNTCGAFMAATLGVATIDYLPYAFLNLINPLVAVTFGYAGVKIMRLPQGGLSEAKPMG